ncbi:FAD/NAD(P)-binding domain-containing protein [Mycena crocata]|nr:FAD/NAD(P)-binding domain-containing protein [Mycena crocata]
MAISTEASSQTLNVSIVGAGIAGLTSAVALRRNGHRVQVFEASEIKTEIGAALGVQTNALRVLDHLGVSRPNLKGVAFDASISFGSGGGEGKIDRWLVPYANENPGLMCHRSDLHDELKRLAVGDDGEGPPATLRLGTKVVKCDAEEGTITLHTGEVIQADILLGADGINSVVRTDILGSAQKATASGWSCFRAVFETPHIREIAGLEWLTAGVSGVRTIVPKDGPFRMLLMYPCRNETLVNFVGFYTDSPGEGEGWTPTASREEILAKFKDFDPKFLAVLDLPLHSPVLKWQLRALPLLSTWIRGRAALLGDAAHATLPLLGQGADIAMEEAVALGCLLPAGTKRKDIPARLKAYQDLRKSRGEFVQTESVDQVSRIINSSGAFATSQDIQAYLFEYDTVKAASECYEDRFGHATQLSESVKMLNLVDQ